MKTNDAGASVLTLLLTCLLASWACFDTSPLQGTASAADSAAAALAESPKSAPAVDTPEPRSACERYVAAVSGRAKLALLDDPEVGTLAAQAPGDLVMCGAVRSDSDALCERLLPVEHGPGGACQHMRSIFHELRSAGGRSFMFDDRDWEGCRVIPLFPALCDSLRKAMRSADPRDCAATDGAESICRAYIALDKSLCHAEGKLKLVEFVAKLVGNSGIEESCRRTIENRAFLAQGLERLAESGPPLERELARAALGRPDACAPFAQSALTSCLQNVAAASSGAAPRNASQAVAGATKTLLVPIRKLPRPFVRAEPNPVPAISERGATLISWNTGDGVGGRVLVSRDGSPERELAAGSQGSQVVEEITPGSTYEFRLYAAIDPRKPLASVRVTTSGTP